MQLLGNIPSGYTTSGGTGRSTVNREPFLQDSWSLGFVRSTLIIPEGSFPSTTRTLSRCHFLRVLHGLPMPPHFLGWQTKAVPWQRDSGMLLRLGGFQADCPHDCAHWGTSAFSLCWDLTYIETPVECLNEELFRSSWPVGMSFEIVLILNWGIGSTLNLGSALSWAGPSAVGVKKASWAWAARQAG